MISQEDHQAAMMIGMLISALAGGVVGGGLTFLIGLGVIW